MTTPPIIQAVRDIAAARPDFQYTEQEGYESLKGCSYISVRPGSTQGEGCIIGQALSKVGIELDAVKKQEFNTTSSPAVDTLATEFPEWFEGCGDNEINWLTIVQERQDNGERWATAVESADHDNKL